MPPFVIFGLPRSRTAWLSKFLTYGDWTCGHEEIRHCRSLDDVKSWLAQPLTGTAETAAAPFWRLLTKLSPEARIVVVRRPVGDVLASLGRVGCAFDSAILNRVITRLDRKLDQLTSRASNVLSVTFEELSTEAGCARVFEHCLPYKHDPAWWAHMAGHNVQAHMPALMRYMHAYKPQLDKLAEQVKVYSIAAFNAKPFREPDDLVIREETLEVVLRDAQHLMREHCSVVGEAPTAVAGKNWDLMRELEGADAHQILTARCNGKIFGYLMTVLGPSLVSPDIKMACHTIFFASPAIPGLGRKLLHAAEGIVKDKGATEIIFRAGVVGDGPRLESAYRRMGAEPCGKMFRKQL